MVMVASQRRRIRDAGVLRLAALLLPLGACFVDPGRHGSPSDTGSTGTGDPGATTSATTPTTPTTGDATISTISTTSTTSGAELTTTTADASGSVDVTGTPTTVPTTDPTTDPTADPTGQTTAPSTTGPNPAACGNGILEGNEGCDHGPENGGKYCNVDCTAPTCKDFTLNQEESDIDCGGSCSACGLCQFCNDDADCNGSCVGGTCTRTDLLVIDYLTNCGDTTDPWVTGPVVPGGSYIVTAEGGGGSVNGEGNNYGWLAECVGFNLKQMSAPFVYFSPQDAFGALSLTQLQLEYAGGSLRCGLIDPACADNIAGVSLSFTLQCSP